MTHAKFTAICLITMVAFFSCTKEQDPIFKESPSERSRREIKNIRHELVSAPWGWKLTYYPKIDKDKFSDIRFNLNTHETAILFLNTRLGYGGYTFWIKFSEDGTLVMLSDYTPESFAEERKSDFEIRRGASTQLSFTTANYIHRLVNTGFEGSGDFVFSHKTDNGKWILKTMRFLENEREYAVLEKIENAEQWKTEPAKMFQQKEDFETHLANPVLVIKDAAGKTLFESNFRKYINTEQRYALFVQDHTPDLLNSIYYTGIGSGYSFTPQGVWFNHGLRYNSNTLFTFFEKQPNGSFLSKSTDFIAEIKEK